MNPFQKRLWEPVNITSIVVFRILFGILLLSWVVKSLWYGRIQEFYTGPPFHFKYWGFEWVQPASEWGMIFILSVLGLCALFIALGLLYRVSTIFFFFGFTYIFLLDQARYVNHYYLICLLSFLLIYIPANRTFSLDVRLGLEKESAVVPAWTLWVLRLQLGLVYFYAAIAKLHMDWLLGWPMRVWLHRRVIDGLLPSFFVQEGVIYAASFFAIFVDLLATPFLLWKRTRRGMVVFLVFFHLSNAYLFHIGVFPWLMLGATILFFDPAWFSSGKKDSDLFKLKITWPRVLCLFFFIQLLLPLRHFLYPGPANWTEEGHRFSWHMMLRTKLGKITFSVHDKETGHVTLVDPHDYLTAYQVRKMRTRPDMILQFAHHLARGKDVEVRAQSFAALNGREKQHLIDPERDLASVPRTLRSADWIQPLNSIWSEENWKKTWLKKSNGR